MLNICMPIILTDFNLTADIYTVNKHCIQLNVTKLTKQSLLTQPTFNKSGCLNEDNTSLKSLSTKTLIKGIKVLPKGRTYI
jgi:hypothetical protein